MHPRKVEGGRGGGGGVINMTFQGGGILLELVSVHSSLGSYSVIMFFLTW